MIFASIGWREGIAARQESNTEALFPKRKRVYYSEFASGIATLSNLQTILMRGQVSNNNRDHDAPSQNPALSFPDVLLRTDSQFRKTAMKYCCNFFSFTPL